VVARQRWLTSPGACIVTTRSVSTEGVSKPVNHVANSERDRAVRALLVHSLACGREGALKLWVDSVQTWAREHGFRSRTQETPGEDASSVGVWSESGARANLLWTVSADHAPATLEQVPDAVVICLGPAELDGAISSVIGLLEAHEGHTRLRTPLLVALEASSAGRRGYRSAGPDRNTLKLIERSFETALLCHADPVDGWGKCVDWLAAETVIGPTLGMRSTGEGARKALGRAKHRMGWRWRHGPVRRFAAAAWARSCGAQAYVIKVLVAASLAVLILALSWKMYATHRRQTELFWLFDRVIETKLAGHHHQADELLRNQLHDDGPAQRVARTRFSQIGWQGAQEACRSSPAPEDRAGWAEASAKFIRSACAFECAIACGDLDALGPHADSLNQSAYCAFRSGDRERAKALFQQAETAFRRASVALRAANRLDDTDACDRNAERCRQQAGSCELSSTQGR
jgi:hypothetical protein